MISLALSVSLIENLSDIDTQTFIFEKLRSIKQILSVKEQVIEYKENPETKLKRDLKKAIKEENYELAASLRDRISELKDKEKD